MNGSVTTSRTSPASTAAGAAAAAAVAPTAPAPRPVPSLLSLIGFGIDSHHGSGAVSGSDDATAAATRAVVEALERGHLTLGQLLPSQHGALQAVLRLGVPARPGRPAEPMAVDATKIKELLPAHLPLLSTEVTVGGLRVPENRLCIAVAFLTVHVKYNANKGSEADAEERTGSPVSRQQSPIMPPLTWEQVERETAEPAPPRTAWSPDRFPLQSRGGTGFPRNTSMEMLARISAQIREEEEHPQVIHHHYPAGAAGADPTQQQPGYRKLPPLAVTSEKNTKRLLVRHSYRDFAGEPPQPGEADHAAMSEGRGPLQSSPHRGAGAAPGPAPSMSSWAFPMKLHETLHQIELEGHASIIGFLPHGRSFKIFKQKEFVEDILPRYFVMTKKSSFLRQLNLYGFKRLCRVGPDQGSYYHELFLRGRLFLTKRMQREKVNGNGIRTAGNPDEEPDFSEYPPLPPLRGRVAAPITETPAVATDGAVMENGQSVRMVDVTPPPPPPPPPPQDDAIRSDDGFQASFPLRLQRILDRLEAVEHTDVISWLPHGRAFIVHDVNRFVAELMPKYFNQSKYSSFQRQLHMYGFSRITSNGPDKGAYHHRSFLRGEPALASGMRRTRVNGKGTRRPGNPDLEPDFYRSAPMPAVPRGAPIVVPLEQGLGAARYAKLDRSVGDGEASEGTAPSD